MKYAIIRHEKIKAGRHLVAAGLHLSRGAETHNADPMAPVPVVVLAGTNKPHRDVTDALRNMGIAKVRKNGNVCFEVILSTSPGWWTDRGWRPGERLNDEAQAALDAWVKANMIYLRDRFGELMPHVTLHLDEKTPHIHALVIPAQLRADGRERGTPDVRWRLSAEKMIRGPSHLKSICTEYAAHMKHLGLVRGEDRKPGEVEHKPAKVWQAEQAAAGVEVGTIVVEQSRLRDEATATVEAARLEAERIIADAHRQAQAERAELATLRSRLEAMIVRAERLLAPILQMAERFWKAKPIARQAMGDQAELAATMADNAPVVAMAAMLAEHRANPR